MLYDIIDKKAKTHTYNIFSYIPKHVLAMMEATYVRENLELCEKCNLDSVCHILLYENENKNIATMLCPVLFHDALKPEWKIEQLNGYYNEN